MPRRLIIGILVVLILGIVGGTIALIVQRFRGDEAATTPTTSPGGLTPAQPGNQQVTNPTGDDDSDGLTNADEVLWGTSSANPDTDNDGYKDGEEVAANHNPTIPAPGDKLPADFQPGQNVQPLAPAPLQADQYFSEDLKLAIPTENLTAAYNQAYPENQRTQATIVAFAKQQPIITSLPLVQTKAIKAIDTNSKVSLGHYLDTAKDVDALINRTIMSTVLTDLFEKNDPGTAFGQSALVTLHQQKLLELPVPPAAIELQKLLLGFTQLLAVTYEQMGLWNEDPVKALVAINQLDTIDRKYFPLIRAELARLEQVHAGLR